jgi:hypothetical protein
MRFYLYMVYNEAVIRMISEWWIRKDVPESVIR